MALNVKNAEVERLAAEVAQMAGESKTEAIRRALLERRERLTYRIGPKRGRARRFLEEEVWPLIPAEEIGRRLTHEEEDRILGYGSGGV